MAKKNIASFGLLAVLIIAMAIGDSLIQPAFGGCNSLDSNDGMRDTFIRTPLAGRTMLQREQLTRNDGCSGSSCNVLNDPCCSGCSCIPVGIIVGVCAGSCC